MSGWLGAINYGVIVANDVESFLGNRDPLETLEALAVDGGPPDLAMQHDHYAYGTEKIEQ
jgi:hypothetical protein